MDILADRVDIILLGLLLTVPYCIFQWVILAFWTFIGSAIERDASRLNSLWIFPLVRGGGYAVFSTLILAAPLSQHKQESLLFFCGYDLAVWAFLFLFCEFFSFPLVFLSLTPSRDRKPNYLLLAFAVIASAFTSFWITSLIFFRAQQ
jgi:hypothetical protein